METNKIKNIAWILANLFDSSKIIGEKRENIKEKKRRKIKYGLYGYGPIFDKAPLIQSLINFSKPSMCCN